VLVLAAATLVLTYPRAREAQADTRGESYRPGRGDAGGFPITRGTSYLGIEVVGRDGKKLGNIADYVVVHDAEPRLRYVLIATGGLLDIGGDVRAVPAAALHFDEDTVSLDLDTARFRSLPVITGDRAQFLASPAQAKAIATTFHLKSHGPALDPGRVVFLSDIRGKEACGRRGEPLGTVENLWVNFARQRAPYLEIRPKPIPLVAAADDEHFGVAVSTFERRDEAGRVILDIAPGDLARAPAVDATEAVRVVNDGEIGRVVLRVAAASVARGETGAPRGAGRTEPEIPERVQLAAADYSNASLRHFSGQDVRDAQGRKLGSVDDFMIDAKSGQVAWAVIATDGLLGVGNDHRAVPLKALKPGENGFVVPVQRADWELAPTLNEDNYKQGRPLLDETAREQLGVVFGAKGLPEVAADYVRASDLRGKAVENQGRKIGVIEEVVVNPKNGRAAVVLRPSPDDQLSDANRRFVVPMVRIDARQATQRAVPTDLTGQELARVESHAENSGARH
jgi:sporulation protein YlmC with PRC-barrel domain